MTWNCLFFPFHNLPMLLFLCDITVNIGPAPLYQALTVLRVKCQIKALVKKLPVEKNYFDKN